MRQLFRHTPRTLLLAALLALLAACGGGEATPTPSPVPTASPTPGATPTPTPGGTAGLTPGDVGSAAPEFAGIVNWINSPPLTMEELRGKVVLIDFWTYTCINCIRTLPYIKEWHAKYADRGLVIVGVHSPEFEFEKRTDNVVRSAEESGLAYPIAQDNEFGTWRAFNNNAWPSKFLIDAAGTIRYAHVGEGAYRETEEQIRALLTEAGADLSDVAVNEASAQRFDPRAYDVDPEKRITREIYGGYQRNASTRGIYVAQPEYYDAPNQAREYADPGVHLNQFFYLHGLWENGYESLRHARVTESYEDYLALKFVATSVNIVLDPAFDATYDVQVTLDGGPVPEESAGGDLIVKESRSYFVVDEPRLYAIVELDEFSTHEMTLSSNSDQFALFAFTFGAYPEGP